MAEYADRIRGTDSFPRALGAPEGRAQSNHRTRGFDETSQRCAHVDVGPGSSAAFARLPSAHSSGPGGVHKDDNIAVLGRAFVWP